MKGEYAEAAEEDGDADDRMMIEASIDELARVGLAAGCFEMTAWL